MPTQTEFDMALRAVCCGLPLPVPGNLVAQLGQIRGISSTNGTALLAQPLDAADNDIVSLEDGSPAGDIGDTFKIDDEAMTVIEVINNSNYKVLRAQQETAKAAHDVGAQVIMGPPDLRTDVRDFLRANQTEADTRMVAVTYTTIQFT